MLLNEDNGINNICQSYFCPTNSLQNELKLQPQNNIAIEKVFQFLALHKHNAFSGDEGTNFELTFYPLLLSSIKMIKRSGPNIEPWGTWLVTGCALSSRAMLIHAMSSQFVYENYLPAPPKKYRRMENESCHQFISHCLCHSFLHCVFFPWDVVFQECTAPAWVTHGITGAARKLVIVWVPVHKLQLLTGFYSSMVSPWSHSFLQGTCNCSVVVLLGLIGPK